MSEKALSALRYEVALAKERYERSNTYANAVNLQSAKAALEAFFKREREAWGIIRNDGDIVPDPNHVPLTHLRVIDGGKEII